MKIIKQISDTDFVIRMEEHDLTEYNHVSDSKLIIAHDYVQFNDRISIAADPYHVTESLKGPYAWCSNNIQALVGVQIPIRTFKYAVMPILENSKYLKEKHFEKRETGEFGYNYSNQALFFYKDGQQVSFKLKNDTSWSTVSKHVFDALIYPMILKKLDEELELKKLSKK